MGFNKGHKEFHALDLNDGWEALPAIRPASSRRSSPARSTRPQARLALAAAALCARRLHHQAVRARILGRGLPRFGRSHGRQRRAGRGRHSYAPNTYACGRPAPITARSSRERLHAVRNPLLRPGLTVPLLVRWRRRNPASRGFRRRAPLRVVRRRIAAAADKARHARGDDRADRGDIAVLDRSERGLSACRRRAHPAARCRRRGRLSGSRCRADRRGRCCPLAAQIACSGVMSVRLARCAMV